MSELRNAPRRALRLRLNCGADILPPGMHSSELETPPTSVLLRTFMTPVQVPDNNGPQDVYAWYIKLSNNKYPGPYGQTNFKLVPICAAANLSARPLRPPHWASSHPRHGIQPFVVLSDFGQSDQIEHQRNRMGMQYPEYPQMLSEQDAIRLQNQPCLVPIVTPSFMQSLRSSKQLQ